VGLGAKPLKLRYCAAVIFIVSLVAASTGTSRAFEIATDITQNGAGSSAADTAGENSTSCEGKLTAFVAELDALLGDRTTPLDTINFLKKRYFPLNHCDIDRAIDICRRSKYVKTINRYRVQTSFVFSNYPENRYGYNVGFLLSNLSGDSEFPGAMYAMKSL
jgi:hypothetical protein